MASGRVNVIEIPSSNPTGNAVLCIHGLCCDARIFSYSGAKLSQVGYNVYSVDLPGHGRSNGQKGNLDFGTCMQSIDQIITELKKSRQGCLSLPIAWAPPLPSGMRTCSGTL